MSTHIEQFINKYRGHLTSSQCQSILHGQTLTAQLRDTVQQALGLTPHLAESKRNTLIWSPPGAGKTFTVRAIAESNNINLLTIAGVSSMWGMVAKLTKLMYKVQMNPNITTVPVWIDDCDSLFADEKSLNLMKIILDTDDPRISWDTSVASHIKTARVIDPELADALEFFNNGGVGIEVPLDQCRFLTTTNKKFASVQNLKGNASKRVMHEVAIRDRVVYRAFDLSSDESWGWLASVAIAEDIFKDDNFALTDDQLLLLLKTFHQNWDKLTSCSMRAVKDAAATLYNYPNEFTDIFNRNYCG